LQTGVQNASRRRRILRISVTPISQAFYNASELKISSDHSQKSFRGEIEIGIFRFTSNLPLLHLPVKISVENRLTFDRIMPVSL